MRCRTAALLAIGMLSASACSTTPPMPQIIDPTPPRAAIAEACASACPLLPLLEEGARSEGEVGAWAHEVLSRAGECRRQHDACRASVTQWSEPDMQQGGMP